MTLGNSVLKSIRHLFVASCGLVLLMAQAGANDGAFRVDCRYHNDEGLNGIEHCYASAIYRARVNTETADGGIRYSRVKFGVACDEETIYNNSGRVQHETTSVIISPKTAAFPAMEIEPADALIHYGTYESILDLRDGRLSGSCYVRSAYGTAGESEWPFE